LLFLEKESGESELKITEKPQKTFKQIAERKCYNKRPVLSYNSYKCKITSVLKVETDIITSIAECPVEELRY
jgi:hypothetical protein